MLPHHVYDWATGVPELLRDGENVYLVGHDTLGWTTDGAWTFILPDALGSARQTTNATGAVTGSRAWSPCDTPRTGNIYLHH